MLHDVAVYEYRCRTCDDVFERRRAMSEADALAECPNGHTDAVRLLSVFASVGASPARSAVPPVPCGGQCVCHPG
jgi:putative FmdB family regulatory protein